MQKPNFCQLCLAVGVALLFDSITTCSLSATEVKLDLLCPKFPLNSRCQNYQHSLNIEEFSPNSYLLDRDDFCANFSFNSRCQQEPTSTIDFNLAEEEWIQIIKNGNKLEFALAERTEDFLASLFVAEAESFIPLSDLLSLLPFSLLDILPLDLNRYHWQNYEITQVIFQNDRCKSVECHITGINSIDLPENTHFSQGLFTVKYWQQDLQRSVIFRLPQDIKVVPIKTITIEVPNGI